MKIKYSIKNKLSRFVAIITLLAFPLMANADGKAEVTMLNKDTVICDGGVIDIKLRIVLDHSAPVFITYQIDDVTIIEPDPIPYADIVALGNEYPFPGRDYRISNGNRHETHIIKLLSLKTQNMVEPLKLNDSFKIDIYATPKAEIMNDNLNCGCSMELQANNQWNDMSKYLWSSDDGTLTDTDKEVAHLSVPSNRKVNVTLTETVVGKCFSSATKEIELLGTPTVEISREDPVVLCSTLQDDENFNFTGSVTASGFSPFTLYMSSGQVVENVLVGTSTQNFIQKHGGNLTVVKMTDKNGCVALNSDVTGFIEVFDRKPQLALPIDTIISDGEKGVALNVEPSQPTNTFLWQIVEPYTTYDSWFNDATSPSTIFNSNIDGLIGLRCIETNTIWEQTTYRECLAIDTMLVNIDRSIFCPSGMSPNGDGKNDRLIVRGLPANNYIAVFDMQGKIIFEQENYRNDWTAEGVDDGYYYYVVKSGSKKLVKQTLVIKRSIFD